MPKTQKTTKRGRKFPYYIVIGIDKKTQKIHIVDLNSIQKKVEENGKLVTVVDVKGADIKWITAPGQTKAAKAELLNYIEEMAFLNGKVHPKIYMIFDHRRFSSDPFHVEYHVKIFDEWYTFFISADDIVVEAETVEE